GDDRLSAGDGTDTLYGGAGNDILYGSTGDDWLQGGQGMDTMNGGKGADTFSITLNAGHDIIEDFHQGQDKLQLDSTLIIERTFEIDHNNDGRMDTVLEFDTDNTLTLLGVSDLDSSLDLF
ncbi:M10 family metallopeptidase C-terminal domain-containing protein, partial [Magnetococcales bacterium HHB-1]